MATPALFQFFLMKDATTYYQVTAPRTVGTTTTAAPLQRAPDGWFTTQIRWQRNQTYRALMRSLTNTYTFVLDGATILRHIYALQGVEGKCTFVIKKRRSSDWTYQPYYTGDLDFSQYDSLLKGVTINVLDGGLSALVKAYETTPFQIPILDADAVKINFDGILLKGAYTYITPANTYAYSLSQGSLEQFFATYSPTVDGNYPIAATNGATSRFTIAIDPTITTFPSQAEYDNYSFQAQQAMAISIGINFAYPQYFHYRNDSGSRTVKLVIEVIIAQNNQPFSQRHTIYQDPAGYLAPGGNRYLIINVAPSPATKYNVVAGDRVYILYYFDFIPGTGSGNPLVAYNYPQGNVIINSEFTLASTISKGYRLYYLLQKLTASLSNGVNTATSTFLSNPLLPAGTNFDNVPYQVVATCGDALRNLAFDTAGNPSTPAIQTTLSDFFASMAAMYCVGMGVENEQLVLEHISYFFDKNTEIYDLGEVTDLEIKPAKEYMGNVFNVGYPNQTYDSLNGKDEFNTTSVFKTPITRIPKTFDWVSKYRADMYGIETQRANLDGKLTTDSSSDNDVFLIDLTTSLANGAFNLNRPQNNPGNSASGLIEPATAENLTLTPERCFYRNGPLVHMITKLLEGQNITYQISDKNSSLISNLGTGTITEAADVPISNLAAPVFSPHYITFKKSLDNINDLMASYPKGYFRLTWQGDEYKGFIEDVGVNPGNMDVYQFILLAHPDTDLTKYVF